MESGLGVSALNPRNMTAGMMVWADGPHDLPELTEVIRTGAVADAEVLAALRDTLASSLIERGT
ncbi:MAG: hypothetical protein HKN01_08585 [Acidimicrobiia bacterium]|nr:hypothetical protein [Acidimicrobiia bacterium]